MSLSFSILGSGSKGNCTLVSLDSPGAQRCILIDCGLSIRATNARLAPLGLGIEDISDILITHFDTDHFYQGWHGPIDAHDIKVHIHQHHRGWALRRGFDGRRMRLYCEGFQLDGAARIEPVLLAHDDLGSVGFVIEHHGVRLGFATDLGRVPEAMFDRFVNLHALAIESNYDEQMQIASDRPMFLKQRIMGPNGHLSNEQSLKAVLKIDAQSDLSHIVTLHLSQQCNDPRIIKRLYVQHVSHLLDRLTISHQHRPSALLSVHGDGEDAEPAHPRPGQQRAMFSCPREQKD